MTEFENVLQECLRDLEQGVSEVEGCLQRHPEHASQLEPVLLTSAYLARGREARLSPAFKARVRTRLIQEMHAHTRRRARPNFIFMRLASSLAVLLLALLVSGTVHAQRALPGESFYGWKRASENAWRMVSSDLVETDLAIAERRLNELIAVRNDPVLQAQTLDAYLQVTDRLRSQADPENEARIWAVLASQAEELSGLGILPEPFESDFVPSWPGASATPATTPLPILESPQANPTELPLIVPTLDVVPETLPTIQDPPQIIPTVESPLPLP